MASIISDVQKRFANWRHLLKNKTHKELLIALGEAPLVEVAEFLAEQKLGDCIDLFLLLKQDTQATLFGHFHENKQLELYNALQGRAFAPIFGKMSSDLRADFYLSLADKQRFQLLPFLEHKVRQDVITLSGYSSDQAGGIMNTDFIVLDNKMTAKEALEKIRQTTSTKKMLYFLYVVDEHMKLISIVDLKDLIMASPATQIADFANETFVAAHLYEDRESVARKVEKYDLPVIPIINETEQLVGIVSYDDAIDVIRAEETEDMELFMGIRPHKEDHYLKISSVDHFYQRIGWVSGLFILSVCSSLIIHSYEATLQKWHFLALYLPTISDTGGNVGSQAATMVIRALSLGQITLKNWLSIIYKEGKVALFLAFILFFLSFIKVFILSTIFSDQDEWILDSTKIAFTISLSIAFQTFTSTLIGATLPLLMKKLGKDPAAAASPAITTLVDISGLFIYLGMATLFYTYLF